MKIVNKTQWETKPIRELLTRIGRDELDPQQRKRLIVTITYGVRGSSPGGRAGLHSNWMILKMPRPQHVAVVNPVAVCMMIAHEMAHVRGVKHAQMPRHSRYTWHGNYREVYAWAAQTKLTVKESSPVKPSNLRQERYQRVVVLEEKWSRQLKVIQRRLKTLHQRRIYYERTLLAAQEPCAGGNTQ